MKRIDPQMTQRNADGEKIAEKGIQVRDFSLFLSELIFNFLFSSAFLCVICGSILFISHFSSELIFNFLFSSAFLCVICGSILFISHFSSELIFSFLFSSAFLCVICRIDSLHFLDVLMVS